MSRDAVLTVIMWNAARIGEYSGSLAALAREAGVGAATARRVLAELEADGVITRERRPGAWLTCVPAKLPRRRRLRPADLDADALLTLRYSLGGGDMAPWRHALELEAAGLIRRGNRPGTGDRATWGTWDGYLPDGTPYYVDEDACIAAGVLGEVEYTYADLEWTGPDPSGEVDS